MSNSKSTMRDNGPKWFLGLAIFAVLWNLFGVSSFFMHALMTDEAKLALPADEQALYASYPLWTAIVFGIAVFAGLIGSIGLLLRKQWAKPFFGLSLIAILIQMTHSLLFTKSIEVYGPQSVILPVLIILIALFLAWFSNKAARKNWIN